MDKLAFALARSMVLSSPMISSGETDCSAGWPT